MHTLTSRSIIPRATSIVMTAPVRPIPALQWTTTGPDWWTSLWSLIYCSNGRAAAGVPWSGHRVKLSCRMRRGSPVSRSSMVMCRIRKCSSFSVCVRLTSYLQQTRRYMSQAHLVPTTDEKIHESGSPRTYNKREDP